MFAHIITSALGARSALGMVNTALAAAHRVNDALRAPRAYTVYTVYVETHSSEEWDIARDGRLAIEGLTQIAPLRNLLAACAVGWAAGGDILAPFAPGGVYAQHAATAGVAAELAAIRARLQADPAAAAAILAFGALAERSARQRAERAAAQTTE